MPEALKESITKATKAYPLPSTQIRWDIPKHWIWVRAGDIALIVGGGTPKAGERSNFTTSGNGIGWITPADLTGYKPDTIEHGRRDLTERGVATSGAQILPPGTVLLSTRAPIGYSVVTTAPLSTNQGFKSLVLRGGVSPFYIRYYFIASRSYLNSLGSGLTFAELSSKRIAEIPIPLPPIAEQHRIVARLQALEKHSQQAHAHLVEFPDLLAKIRQSLLSAASSGMLSAKWRVKNKRNIAAWKDLTFSDLISKLTQGWSPKCDSVMATSSEWGVIKTTAVQPLNFKSLENKRLPRKLKPVPDLSIRAGDILITRAGPRSRCGVTTMVPKSYPRLMVCDKVYRLRVNEETITASFFSMLLNSPAILSMLDEAKTGTSESGMNITQAKLLNMSHKIPPISEQHEIVRLVYAALARLDTVVTAHATAATDLDQLNQALLARAFRGQLVDQHPADESAIILLNRINVEPAPKIMKKPRNKSIAEKESVRTVLAELPAKGFTFEQLSAHTSMNYEMLRDEIFEILGERQPILRQVFDTETRRIYFVRN